MLVGILYEAIACHGMFLLVPLFFGSREQVSCLFGIFMIRYSGPPIMYCQLLSMKLLSFLLKFLTFDVKPE